MQKLIRKLPKRFANCELRTANSNPGTRYLVLLGPVRYDAIYDTIYDTKIKIDSYNSLPIEKTMTFHNVITLIQPVFNKNQNHYYCMFLEKVL